MAGIPLDEIGWSTRTKNALDNAGLKTTDDLARVGATGLLSLPNLGRRSLKEIKDQLETRGLSLEDSPAPLGPRELELLFDQLQQKLIRAFNEQARTVDERLVAVVAALNATQRANGLDQMMDLLTGIRRAIDLRLDDMKMAVRLATRPGMNGVSE